MDLLNPFGYRNGVWALHSHIPDRPHRSVCAQRAQGQPGQPLGHLLVLSQEAKSLEQASEMPLDQKPMQLDTDLYQKPLCEGEHNTEIFPGLTFPALPASITVICLMTSSIRWPAQPSMEPPSSYTSKCSFNIFVPLATGFPGSAFCNLFSHSAHNLFLLPVSDSLPELFCPSSWLQNLFVRAVQENFQCDFIGKYQLS